MKNHILSFGLMLFCLFSLTNCTKIGIKGNGNLVSQSFEICDYEQIMFASQNFKLEYEANQMPPALWIETDSNIMELFDIQCKNNQLKIDFKDNQNNSIKMHQPTKLVIKTNSEKLSEINAAGSGYIELMNNTEYPKLELNIAGNITVNAGQINLNTLICKSAGSCIFNFCGRTDNLIIQDAGKNNYNALELATLSLKVESAGFTNLEADVTDDINVSIVGGGSIRYKGNPNIQNKSIGSVSITKID